MSNEHRFVILISRLTFSESEEHELYELLGLNLDWQTIIGICIRNKILGLLWYNLVKRNYHHAMIKQYRLVCRYFYECNRKNNQELLNEFAKIETALRDAEIAHVPLKGIHFLSDIYIDIGSRQMGDIDIFVLYEDYAKIHNVMEILGYIEGEYEYVKGAIIPIDRKMNLLHKTQLNNFHPFKRIASPDEINEVYSIDYAHRIYGDVSGELSRLFMKLGTDDRVLYLLYLCGHLYKEGINPYWIFNHKDNNLLKFCDLYEYILRNISADALKPQSIQDVFYQYPKIADAVYYTLYFLNLIYASDIIESLMNDVSVRNIEAIDGFINERNGTRIKWKSDFFDRMFYGVGKQELQDKPLYMQHQINPSDRYIGVEDQEN